MIPIFSVIAASEGAVERYLPLLVRERLIAEGGAPLAPGFESLRAATLFADIAGFTALTERLARRGSAGAEHLASLLNDYFGRFIDVVGDAGGDVLKLAGDSALAIWRVRDDLPIEACVRCATETALYLQEVLGRASATADDPLATRIAVGAGDLVVMHVGGVYDRWEFVVAGPALLQLAMCGQASPGRVVLSPEALALCPSAGPGDRAADGAIQLHPRARAVPPARRDVAARLGSSSLATLRSYLPGAVRPRLDAGQHAFIAELRTVAVLFVNLHGAEKASEKDLGSIDDRVRAVQAALYRYEGSLNKLSIDEKGITVVAAMGLPPFAHEDDAQRAVRAARMIRDELRGLGAECSIGVAHGRVFCGVVGGDRRCEYTVIGDVVNLAARLMQAARGGILCDAPTREAAATRFRFDALAPIRVKGKADAVAVYAPVEAIVTATAPRPIVGRRAELERIGARLADLREGRGGVVLIEGDAGIGKSRLVAEVGSRARHLGVLVLEGAADSTERSTSYRTWRPVFAALLGLEPESAPSAAAVRAAVRGDAGDDRIPLLNEVLALGLADTDLTAEMRGEVRADNTRDLLLTLLEAAARRAPLAIVLEDVHWSDSASLALLLACARRVRGVLLVVATRPIAAQPAEVELRGLVDAASDHVRLSALDAEDAAVLVRSRLGATTLSDDLTELIQARGQGNPFFSQELASGMRDAGLIVVYDGEARAARGVDLATAALPDSIGSIITARIDRLSPAEQLTVKVASVIGRVFDLGLLSAVVPGGERDALRDVLARLEEQELVSVESIEPEPTYAFRHALIVDAVYGLMLYAQRRDLHRAVAEWHERAAAAPYGLLAHHWAAAGDEARALEALEKAGDQALRSGAYVEAASFLHRALALWERAASPLDAPGARIRRGRIERQLGDAEFGLGKQERAKEILERALETIGARAPFAGGARARILAGIAEQVVHRLAPRREVDDARKERALELARGWGQLGIIYVFAGDANRLFAACLNSLNQAELAGPSPELAASYAQLSFMAGLARADRLADGYARRARETAADVRQSTAALGMVHFWAAAHFTNRAEWSKARAEYAIALRIYEALGDRRRWTEATCGLSSVTHYEAKFEERLPLGAEVYARGKDTRDVQSQAWGLLDQAESLLPLGRDAEARAMLERATTTLRDGLAKTDALWAHGLYAIAAFDAGDHARARSEANESLRWMSQVAPTTFYALEGYAGATEAFLELWEARDRLGDGDASWAGLRGALKQFQRFAFMLPFGAPRYQLCAGRAAWAMGEKRAARKAWAKSLAAAERLGMPYEAARARFEIGRHAGRSDPEWREVERARDAFVVMGARRDERKAAELLAR